jgi:hypothetical protein
MPGTLPGGGAFSQGFAEGAMPLRDENSFLGPCPFPKDDLIGRAAWDFVSREAEKEHAFAMAATVVSDPASVTTWVNLAAEKFEVRAKATLLMLCVGGLSDRKVDAFKAVLTPMREEMCKWVVSSAPSWLRDEGLSAELKLRLIQRSMFWTGVALQRLTAAQLPSNVDVITDHAVTSGPQSGPIVAPGTHDTTRQTTWPNRAAWLKGVMTDGIVIDGRFERPISAHRIWKLGGPEKATTARILNGEHVQDGSLIKLAAALKVPLTVIPND